MFNIYGKQGCSSCLQAKAFLESQGIDYNYLMLGKDYDLQKFMSFGVPHRTFPLITKVVKYDGIEMEEYIGGLVELKEVLATKYSK